MKKTAYTLIFTLVITIALFIASGTALASDYDHCAEALQAMGLFQGSTNGFELDRQATRAEGAVMLVRLLGAEEEALNGDYSHPFLDVPDWASPHIAYMYETGLTKGTGATTFSPQGICDLQMYSTFILRALGYEETAGDFTYAAATDFAYKLGVVDLITGSGAFLRDNMAAISYTALFASPKGTQTALLAQLIEQGAVNSAAAQPYLTLFADYAQLHSPSAPAEFGIDIPMEIKFNIGVNMDMGAEGKMDLKYDTLLQLDASAVDEVNSIEEVLAAMTKIRFGMINQIVIDGGSLGEEVNMDLKLDLYLLDGTLYLNTDLGKILDLPLPEKLKFDMASLENLLDEMDIDISEVSDLDIFANLPTQEMLDNVATLLPTNPEAAFYGIAQVKAIKSSNTADDGKRLDVTQAGLPSDLIHSAADLVYSGIPEIKDVIDAMEFSIGNFQYSYFLDKNDALTGLKIDMSVDETILAGTEDELTAKATMQMELHITKTGTEVNITLPGNAEDYVDLLEVLEAIK